MNENSKTKYLKNSNSINTERNENNFESPETIIISSKKSIKKEECKNKELFNNVEKKVGTLILEEIKEEKKNEFSLNGADNNNTNLVNELKFLKEKKIENSNSNNSSESDDLKNSLKFEKEYQTPLIEKIKEHSNKKSEKIQDVQMSPCSILNKAQKGVKSNYIPDIDFLHDIYKEETEIPQDCLVTTYFLKLRISEYITFILTILCKKFI